MCGLPARARDTVATETPNSRAIYFIVIVVFSIMFSFLRVMCITRRLSAKVVKKSESANVCTIFVKKM